MPTPMRASPIDGASPPDDVAAYVMKPRTRTRCAVRLAAWATDLHEHRSGNLDVRQQRRPAGAHPLDVEAPRIHGVLDEISAHRLQEKQCEQQRHVEGNGGQGAVDEVRAHHWVGCLTRIVMTPAAVETEAHTLEHTIQLRIALIEYLYRLPLEQPMRRLAVEWPSRSSHVSMAASRGSRLPRGSQNV